MKTCESLKNEKEWTTLTIMKRKKKWILHLILGQELWEEKKIKINKGNSFEPHLDCEKKEKLKREKKKKPYTISHAKGC